MQARVLEKARVESIMAMNRASVALTFIVLAGFVLAGCSTKKKAVTPLPHLQPCIPVHQEMEPSALRPPPRQMALEKADKAIAELKEILRDKEDELAMLEEHYKALEIELAGTVEEVLLSKASMRGVQSRALATLRIAEVRVLIETITPSNEHTDVSNRLRRANEFLLRADQALEDENYGGSAFLAQRAGELARQAKLLSEFHLNLPNLAEQTIPIVPPRRLEARVNCNLREGPSIDAPRVGGLLVGQKVAAVARVGNWYQVETKSGQKAWLHRSVVR